MFPVSVVTSGNELTTLQKRAVFQRLGYGVAPADDTIIKPDDCLRLWIFMLLGRMPFMSSEQRDLVFNELSPTLDGVGGAMSVSEYGPAAMMIAVADGRFVTWTKRIGWLDLTNGDSLREIKHPPLETLGYNLSVLFSRNTLKCQQIKQRLESQNAKSETP